MITGGEQVTSKQLRERRQQDLEDKKGNKPNIPSRYSHILKSIYTLTTHSS